MKTIPKEFPNVTKIIEILHFRIICSAKLHQSSARRSPEQCLVLGVTIFGGRNMPYAHCVEIRFRSLWECFGGILVVFWGCSGGVLGVFLVMFWGCFGTVLAMFWGFSGGVSGMFSSFWVCSGSVPELFWGVLVLVWGCSGSVLAMFRG